MEKTVHGLQCCKWFVSAFPYITIHTEYLHTRVSLSTSTLGEYLHTRVSLSTSTLEIKCA